MTDRTDCKWCGELTSNTGTQECDRCWELRSRIERNSDIAREILDSMDMEEDKGVRKQRRH